MGGAALEAGRLLRPGCDLPLTTASQRPLHRLAEGVWVDVPDQRRRSPVGVLQREVALLGLRARSRRSGRPLQVQRLAGANASSGRLRSVVRDQLLGQGLVVSRTTDPAPSLLDRACRAGGVEPTSAPRLAAGNSLLQFGRRADGAAVVLRLGTAGGPGDPRPAADALERLQELGSPIPAPRLFAAGSVGVVPWTLEERLPGRPPRRLTLAVLEAVARAWSRAPTTGDDAAGSVIRDLRRIAEDVPEAGTVLDQVAEVVADELSAYEAVLRHGDLWSGNVLQVAEHVTGVVDWGACVLDGTPGVDILQLFATGWRRDRRLPLGAAWHRQPWHHPLYLRTVAGAGVPIGPGTSARRYRSAVGVAWWASEVAGTLRRYPPRRDDEAWLTANVRGVVATLSAADRALDAVPRSPDSP